MKFKYLIMSFFIIIILIISIALLPVVLVGQAYAVDFRYITLPLLLFMFILLVCTSIFFFFNYRLFWLLEREDWPALAYYLENKIYTKGRFSDRNVRLLASSYLVISDYQSVINLESKTQAVKPSLVIKNLLIFGAARVLSGEYAETALFFRKNIEKCKGYNRQWVQWYYGFSLLLAGEFALAETEFSTLAVSSNDALITGLCAYFLNYPLGNMSLNAEKCLEMSNKGKERVLKALKKAGNWKIEVEKSAEDIHIAIIRRYIEEAGSWLFK